MLLIEFVVDQQHHVVEQQRIGVEQQRPAQRHAERERIDVPAVYQQTAIASFKSIQPSMTVNYGSGGSGKGRTDLASGVTNFAGSDSPIPSTEVANFKGKTVLYFPVFLGPITVSYNLSGVSSLKLDATVLAEIFSAKITSWNNSAITALNPGVSLPSTPITTAAAPTPRAPRRTSPCT